MTQRNVALLVNPTSGKGRGGKNAPIAVDRLRERGLIVSEIIGGSAEESAALARAAVREGADALIACGGDGTIHQAVQAVAETDVPLGIIPLGTGDDNARTLGLPLGDIAAAADVIADGRTRSVDLGHMTLADGTSEYFLAVLSIGFDSDVNEKANEMTWPHGQARYLRAIIATLKGFKPATFTMTLDDEHRVTDAMLISFGNGVSYGGGMKVCPNAKLDDGLLDVTELGAVSTFTFLKSFPSVFKGTHTKFPFVTTHRIKKAYVDAPGQIAYADGERLGPVPVEIEVRPLALRVLAPVHG
ncbi:MAG: diacylglycerol kinase [Actinomycetes bacterium]